MQIAIKARLGNLRESAHAIAGVMRCWARQEWQQLEGHQVDFQERMLLVQHAESLSALISAQLDLLPESRRRLQRNAASRRAILAELGLTLRRAASGANVA